VNRQLERRRGGGLVIGEREELRSLLERYRAAPRGGREHRALADEIDTLLVGPDLRPRVRARCISAAAVLADLARLAGVPTPWIVDTEPVPFEAPLYSEGA
jgi:hypothetical protein